MGSILGWGTKISHAQPGKKKKKKKGPGIIGEESWNMEPALN